MATYTININERTKAGKYLLAYLVSLGMIKTKHKNKAGFDEADADLRENRVYSADNAQDLFNQLMNNV